MSDMSDKYLCPTCVKCVCERCFFVCSGIGQPFVLASNLPVVHVSVSVDTTVTGCGLALPSKVSLRGLRKVSVSVLLSAEAFIWRK